VTTCRSKSTWLSAFIHSPVREVRARSPDLVERYDATCGRAVRGMGRRGGHGRHPNPADDMRGHVWEICFPGRAERIPRSSEFLRFFKGRLKVV